MNITNKTVLITGGGSGIGFQIAKLLSEKSNKVIITGRSEARLKQAAAQLQNGSFIAADITNEADVKRLVDTIKTDFPALDILINNAGQAYVYNLAEQTGVFEKAGEEMLTNYLSIIRLTENLLPLLKQHQEAAIVNVSSVLALVAGSNIPTYSASKAALHSYTQSLRFTLGKTTAVKVFELMPPLVDTEFSTEIGGSNGIHPSVVAEGLLNGLENDIYELHIGKTADVYKLSLASPEEAFKAVNANR
jgi:uncharacterized oxidoreductase